MVTQVSVNPEAVRMTDRLPNLDHDPSHQGIDAMTRTLLCITPLVCLLASASAQAGGGCPSARQVYNSLPVYRPAPTHQPAYRPVSQPYRPISQPYRPVSQPYRPGNQSNQPPRQSVARNITPPPNFIPASHSSRRPVSSPVMSTVDRLKAAKESFRIGHTNKALAHAGMLIQEMPKNANLLQFRSMIYFRKGDFKRAAEDAHEAVKHGAIWSTATIKDLYSYPAIYDRELRTFRSESMTNLSALFLSAYHHLVAGELEEGRDLLRRTLAIKPDHKVAVALIDLIDARLDASDATKLAQVN